MTSQLDVLQVLTPEERGRRAELEEQVYVGMRAGIMAGKALRALQAEKLYRNEYATFEAYGLDVFGLKRSRLYQLIDFADVAEEAAARGVEVSNERLARALGVVTAESYQLVMTAATGLAQGRAPSSAQVAAVANTVQDLAQGMVEHPDTQEPVPFASLPPQRQVEAVAKAVQRGARDRTTFQGTEDVKPMDYVANFQDMGVEGALRWNAAGYWMEVLDTSTGELQVGPTVKSIWDAPRAWRRRYEAETLEESGSAERQEEMP